MLIAEAVKAAHGKYAEFFAPEPPALTLVSALAEGADRIAAHVAAERGFGLSAVLPFAIEEYEKDFADVASRAEYRELLVQSSSTTILCGARDDQPRAYEIVGDTVLDCSDLVLAVWDGGPSAGRGGTTELLVRATGQGLPIVHIDATGTQPTRILWAGLSPLAQPRADIADVPSAALNKTFEVIEQLVRPPGPSTEVTKLQEFLDASWRPRNWRLEVPLLLALLHLRKPRKADLLPQSPKQLSAHLLELVRAASPAGSVPRPGHACAALASAFGWADALGDRYAQIFRGAYSLNFTFAALAVFMAAASLVASHVLGWRVAVRRRRASVALIVIVNTAAGRRLDWHGRWLETREVAERFRAGIPLWLLGGSQNPSPRASRPGAAGGAPTSVPWAPMPRILTRQPRRDHQGNDRHCRGSAPLSRGDGSSTIQDRAPNRADRQRPVRADPGGCRCVSGGRCGAHRGAGVVALHRHGAYSRVACLWRGELRGACDR
jgi:hypothetical protein